jgi:synaptojanin
MYLYLNESPRSLYLVTGSHDERLGRPRRALVFRASSDNHSQAVVQFLRKEEIDLSNAVRMTSRIVKGCLGLINVSGGVSNSIYLNPELRFIVRQKSFLQ